MKKPNMNEMQIASMWMKISKELNNRPKHIRKGQFVVNVVREFDPNYICPRLFYCEDKLFAGRFLEFMEAFNDKSALDQETTHQVCWPEEEGQ